MPLKIYTVSLFLIISIFFCQISPAQIIEYHTNIKIEKGKKITERYYLIQINDKKSNWLADIEIDYRPQQKININFARIINAQGKEVRKLKKKDIITRNNLSYGTFYQDDLVKEFKLQWNTYPYRIEYSYVLEEDEFFYITGWHPLIYDNIATLNSSLSVSIPRDYKIHCDYSDLFSYSEDFIDGNKIMKWEMGEYFAPPDEIFSPPLNALIPKVLILPQEFKYGTNGNVSSWNDFGNWLSRLNNGTNALTWQEEVQIDNLTSKITDKREIIKILYHYLQDKTKYVNVAIDVGGLRSYPASYVCENKYGDCKALTSYMKAMLKYKGIDSYYTIVKAGDDASKINIDLPGQQFNHVILMIPLEQDTIWLENTSNIHPFNYLGTFTQDRLALIVDKEESKLIHTPKLNIEDVADKTEFHFYKNKNFQPAVKVKKIIKGDNFERFKYFKNHSSKEEQKELIDDDLSFRSLDIQSWEITNKDRDSKQIEVTANGVCQDFIRDIGKMQLIKPRRISIPDMEDPSDRMNPVVLKYPTSESVTSIYEVFNAASYDVSLPENASILSEFGAYKANYLKTDSSIIVSESFTLNDGSFPLNSYEEYYNFIKSISLHQKKSNIILKK